MTIDEAIEKENKIAKENQKIVDTQIVFDNVSISELYCDDTEVIEEHLSNYRKCAEYHEQLAEWLEELKDCRDKNKMVVRIDVKNLGSVTNKAIELAKEQYNKAIDDFAEKAIKIVYESNNRDRNPQPRDMVADIHCKFIELAKQLKVGDGE